MTANSDKKPKSILKPSSQKHIKFQDISASSQRSPVKDPLHIGMLSIRKINIYDSPILAALSTCGKTLYLALDSGATASLITAKKANQLNLKIYKTNHKAVQVDGITDLKILGEVHTIFKRGDIELYFDALVVDKMGQEVDILAGTNFHVENDVDPRMAKHTITIHGTMTVPCASPTLLSLDQLDSRERFVSVKKMVAFLPGDHISFPVPQDLMDHEELAIEPNLSQTSSFFSPQIVAIKDGMFQVPNDSQDIVSFKKNCQAIKVRSVSEVPDTIPIPSPHIETPTPPPQPSLAEVLTQINLDDSKSLSDTQGAPFIKAVEDHLEVFNTDLPGYNDHFGLVKPSISFNSATKPPPIRTKTPNYGEHGQRLFNQKCLLMKQKGVLLDPLEHGIQPLLMNNSWIIKKASACNKPWELLEVKDVRLVTAFDYLNKFLEAPPSKAQRFEAIYSSIAKWRYMGELDFADFYWQLPFNISSTREKRKLSYLCVRTAYGTLAYARAPMGLLGMDSIQEELTDRMLGDLVVAGQVVKIADNIYFGADTLEEMQWIFNEILSRCSKANLRIKPAKVRLNII